MCSLQLVKTYTGIFILIILLRNDTDKHGFSQIIYNDFESGIVFQIDKWQNVIIMFYLEICLKIKTVKFTVIHMHGHIKIFIVLIHIQMNIILSILLNVYHFMMNLFNILSQFLFNIYHHTLLHNITPEVCCFQKCKIAEIILNE